MRNFFSLPFPKNIFEPKTILKSMLILSCLCGIITFSGCRTAQMAKKAKEDRQGRITDRLKNAEAVKANLLKQLEQPKSVDNSLTIKEELDKLQREIDILKSGELPRSQDETDGFKSVKDRTTVYGPIGWTVETTQWILEKLWIIHDS